MNFYRARINLLTLSGLALCLGSESSFLRTAPVVGFALRELSAAIRDPVLQWLVVLFIGIYLAGFCYFRVRQSDPGCLDLRYRPLCLVGIISVAIFSYANASPASAYSYAAIVLLLGATIGQGVGVWSEWNSNKPGEVAQSVVLILLLLLLGASLWSVDYLDRSPVYHGQIRWSGLWNNPNTYGLLTGTGAVLLLAQLLQPKNPKSRLWTWLRRGLVFIVFCVLDVALVRTYSRGAWLGVTLACGYLMWQFLLNLSVCLRDFTSPDIGRDASGSERLPLLRRVGKVRMALSMIAIAGSLYVLFAFTSVHGENPLARRVASVVNANDFSSRNRLASYEGALRMLEDKPWYGFGWGMPERIYGGFYSAPRLNETMALETNDYFVLGTTLGIPALACLGTFIWFGFTQNRAEGATHRFGAGKMLGMDSGSAGHAAYADEWMRIACRAAVIVLLVGFWFDGGLFKLPTAATFWIFLELGRKGAQMPE